jgi:pimeloyl-ACP methyl ester carboxylesterase
MPKVVVNGTGLHWELAGTSGPTMVLVHGAWVDRHDWDEFVPYVQKSYRVLTYDRRGHGDSERPSGQGRMRDDVADLAELLAHLDLAPAHVVGNSYGGMVALRLAADVPDVCLSVTAHEPPFLHLDDRVRTEPRVEHIDRLQRTTIDRLARGDVDAGIRGFLEAVVGPDAWVSAPEDVRRYLRSAAPSFIDDVNDPEPWTVDLAALARFPRPIILTQGEHSAEFYGVILDGIGRSVPRARRLAIEGVGHRPHWEQAAHYASTVTTAIAGPLPPTG